MVPTAEEDMPHFQEQVVASCTCFFDVPVVSTRQVQCIECSSLEMVDNCDNQEDIRLFTLQKQFLNCVPAKKLSFSLVFPNRADSSCDRQDKLLELTVNKLLVKRYPVKPNYQQVFIRFLITHLEDIGAEISENIYTAYCNLLTLDDRSQESHFKHYVLNNTESIVLKESSCLISQGTTGLRTWQAAKALAEWCLFRQDFLSDKNVLELGSGIGLTGLAVTLSCNPKSYWFSDCHPAVLKLLQYNVKVNLVNANKTEDEKVESLPATSNIDNECEHPEIMVGCKIKETEVKVVRLPWDDVEKSEIAAQIKPDVILAADVVYDDSISPVLVKALKHFLIGKQSSKCTLLMACTVRNPETLTNFISLLNSEVQGLSWLEEEAAKPEIFHYSADSAVKIYNISIAV